MPPVAARMNGPDASTSSAVGAGELGLARAFVEGDLDIDGDIVDGILALRGCGINGPGDAVRVLPELARTARTLGSVAQQAGCPVDRGSPGGMAALEAAMPPPSATTTTSATSSTDSSSARR
ncbi:MAG: hypothetical protein R2705_10570 [Ilumatobacteraceae bacterium]